MIKKLWTDPVLSKLIATAITGILVWIGGIWLNQWSAAVAFSFFGSLSSRSIPAWWLPILLAPLLILVIVYYRQRRPTVETLRVIQNVHSSFWGLGKVGDTPAMQVAFYAHVTDISGKPNRILRAEVPKPHTTAQMVLISKNHDARRPQVLDANETADLHACFFVQPVVGVTAKPWQTTIVLIDQYGNRHPIKNCVFRPITDDDAPKPKEAEEHPFSIADPIEKKVVSVLKAEMSRYEICGRACGGLGSIQLVYQDRTFTGVGGDSWRANSPLNQVIVSDPDKASLVSDNLDALLDLYRSLASDEQRNRFVKALLDRLESSKGYLAVAYFIVAVLWSVGSLPEALEKAKRDLPEHETRVFGLSNVLMLLNGLLKYRHSEFSNEMLDEIEKMTHGLSEHTFLIPAKLQAIRTRRLMKAPQSAN